MWVWVAESTWDSSEAKHDSHKPWKMHNTFSNSVALVQDHLDHSRRVTEEDGRGAYLFPPLPLGLWMYYMMYVKCECARGTAAGGRWPRGEMRKVSGLFLGFSRRVTILKRIVDYFRWLNQLHIHSVIHSVWDRPIFNIIIGQTQCGLPEVSTKKFKFSVKPLQKPDPKLPFCRDKNAGRLHVAFFRVSAPARSWFDHHDNNRKCDERSFLRRKEVFISGE